VFILKGLKILCFDTVLQVLILKVFTGLKIVLVAGPPASREWRSRVENENASKMLALRNQGAVLPKSHYTRL
jgi:hypothetical protein